MGVRTRKAVGGIALLVFLAGYIVLAVELSAWLALPNWWSQGIFYLVAGIVWALPLRPLIRWMNGVI